MFNFLTPYLNIIKYGAISIALAGSLTTVYVYYNRYTTAISTAEKQKTDIANLNKDLEKMKDTANSNATKLKEQEDQNKFLVQQLEQVNAKENNNSIKNTELKEKAKHEKDGIIAPTLRNTIDRLYSK
jgi:septal ring factor EnvC (AmiA/AmiB activator)